MAHSLSKQLADLIIVLVAPPVAKEGFIFAKRQPAHKEYFMKKPATPWEQVPDIWKNESQYMNYVRSALRSAWNSNPVKIEFIKNFRIRVPNPNPKGRNSEVYGMQCSRCRGSFIMHPGTKTKRKIEQHTGKKLNYIEINHKKPAGSLKSKDDVGEFASNLLFVTFEDLEPVCKFCHNVITYSQHHKMSEKDAEVELKVIEICKKNVADIKAFIFKNGYDPESNASKRRDQIRNIFKKRQVQG